MSQLRTNISSRALSLARQIVVMQFPGIGAGERDRVAWLLIDRFGDDELRLRVDRLGGDKLATFEQAKDSLAEMSEQDQLKMQQYMDRMTKADSARSNVMAKFSEISSQIIANTK